MSLMWYYRFVANKPGWLLLTIGTVMVSLLVMVVSLEHFYAKPFDFSDPSLGFETRGTDISAGTFTFDHIRKPTIHKPLLMRDPDEVLSRAENELEQSAGHLYGEIAAKEPAPQEQPEPSPKNAHKVNEHSRPITQQLIVDANDKDTMVYGSGKGGFTFVGVPASRLARELSDSRSQVADDMGNEIGGGDDDDSNSVDYDAVFDERADAEMMDQRAHKTQHHTLPADALHNYCKSPTHMHARIGFRRNAASPNATASLFQLDALQSMCRLERIVTQLPSYEQRCERHPTPEAPHHTRCCERWSLPGYVALISELPSCADLREEHVEAARALLQRCLPFYWESLVRPDCWDRKCEAPDECTHNNAVYNVLYWLINMGAFGSEMNETAPPDVSAAMMFLPLAKSYSALELYEELQRVDLSDPLVSVVAMDLGVQDALFDRLLLQDSWYIVLGGVMVVLCLWVYTHSALMTLCTLLAILFSLELAYIVYRWVLGIEFFPFMNLLAVVVNIGIGADDVFIYISTFRAERRTKLRTDADRTLLTQNTLRHAFGAIGITSFTTAFAFFASAGNAITTIKCFAIFAGITVVCNFVIMMTWIPASVAYICNNEDKLTVNIDWPLLRSAGTWYGRHQRRLVDRIAAIVTVGWRPAIWITAFVLLAAASLYTVFGQPGFRLSTSQYVRMFRGHHPFEVYQREFGPRFEFEHTGAGADEQHSGSGGGEHAAAASASVPLYPLLFVWGVIPQDDGSPFDPYARGTLRLDTDFDAYARDTQLWLQQFCTHLRQQPFFHRTTEADALSSSCFIEPFVRHMQRRCREPMTQADLQPCCAVSPFPFEPAVFRRCLPDYVRSLLRTPLSLRRHSDGGPLFGRMLLNESVYGPHSGLRHRSARPTPAMRAFVVDVDAAQPVGASYEEVRALHDQVRIWFDEQLRSAPAHMRGGWVTSDWQFFDLQRALYADTAESVGWSLAVSFVVVLAVTRGDIVVSLWVCASIAMTIGGTLAALVRLGGWRLNVLESLAISTSIGLAVDCSLHYALAFEQRRDEIRTRRAGVSKRRAMAVERSQETAAAVLRHMAGPTAMAALTTGLAGACMLPSVVLPYVQMGELLVALMLMSWLHATLFLMSLLAVAVPRIAGSVGEARWRLDLQVRRWWLQRAAGRGGLVDGDGGDGNNCRSDGDIVLMRMPGSAEAGGGGSDEESDEGADDGRPATGCAADVRETNMDADTEVEMLSMSSDQQPDGARSRTIDGIAELPLDKVDVRVVQHQHQQATAELMDSAVRAFHRGASVGGGGAGDDDETCV